MNRLYRFGLILICLMLALIIRYFAETSSYLQDRYEVYRMNQEAIELVDRYYPESDK